MLGRVLADRLQRTRPATRVLFMSAELPGYLAERGLRLAEDVSTRDAAARYLAPLGRDEPTAAFYRVAVADA
ncbi:hypothetical protein [Dactylosporangium sp. NPDC048998]|uniref:hypothetical protein n=1 Tax=Dactylosporangium sp. NPDC048998 TaxID=3363976 RepID=UPI00371F22A7